MQKPIQLVLRALRLWLRGRVRLRQSLEGVGLADRGERFAAFRKIELEPDPSSPAVPGAIFQVRFRFRNLSPTVNRWLSLIPIPLIVAQPGFRSKTWLLGERHGEFMGRYEFDTVEQAQAYWSSLPVQMMRRRAAPGTLSKQITTATGP